MWGGRGVWGGVWGVWGVLNAFGVVVNTPPPRFRGNFCAACKVIRVRCGGEGGWKSQSDNPPPHSGAAQLYLRR